MGGTSVPPLDFESKVDEIAKLVRQFVELRSGFGEDHVKSRAMQNIFKQFDIDHTSTLTPVEFSNALRYMNIDCTADERQALFERFDTRGAGNVTFKDFSDAVFGLVAAPHGNPEARAIVKKVKTALIKRAGEDAVCGLTRTFVVSDKNKDDSLSKEELFNCLQNCGVGVTIPEVDVILKYFDVDGNGTISLKEFLRGVRGFLNERRLNLIHMAFQCIDVNKSGVITLDEMMQRYDASGHPDVQKGKVTSQEVVRRFMDNWKHRSPDRVTVEEFEEYYRDISAAIDNDNYFELMIRNAWHMSGGEGEAENTSCRRVLVTFKDNHQQIVEIKNDLGIRADDISAMKDALQRQGVNGVVKIELYS